MRSTVFTVLLLLSTLSAAAQKIDFIDPKAIIAGSGEQFINIYGSDLGDHVIYSGKAGEFDVEVTARDERSVTAYVPDPVVNTPDRYTIYVRGERGTAGPAYLDVFDASLPLALQVPDPLTAPSASREGANVYFDVFPVGGSDPRPEVTCTQKSGALFPIGTTTVDCTATNSKGERATGQVFITVFDDLADDSGFQLHIPEWVIADAESVDGANVKFDAWADGTRDPNPTVKCDPVSGSFFRTGDTDVACFASDAYGNTAQGTFGVAVIDPNPKQ
jgi:hypothetical protein